MRALVLAAVLEEPDAVGSEDIAERAGMNKTTQRRRWGSTSGLVPTAVLER